MLGGKNYGRPEWLAYMQGSDNASTGASELTLTLPIDNYSSLWLSLHLPCITTWQMELICNGHGSLPRSAEFRSPEQHFRPRRSGLLLSWLEAGRLDADRPDCIIGSGGRRECHFIVHQNWTVATTQVEMAVAKSLLVASATV